MRAGPSPGPSATVGTGAATPAAGTTSIQGYMFSILNLEDEERGNVWEKSLNCNKGKEREKKVLILFPS